MENKEQRLVSILDNPEFKQSVEETIAFVAKKRSVAREAEYLNTREYKKQVKSHFFKKAGGMLLGGALQLAGGVPILGAVMAVTTGVALAGGAGAVILSGAALLAAGSIIMGKSVESDRYSNSSYDRSFEQNKELSKQVVSETSNILADVQHSISEYTEMKKVFNETNLDKNSPDYLKMKNDLQKVNDSLNEKLFDFVEDTKKYANDADFVRLYSSVDKSIDEQNKRKNNSVFSKLKKALSSNENSEKSEIKNKRGYNI